MGSIRCCVYNSLSMLQANWDNDCLAQFKSCHLAGLWVPIVLWTAQRSRENWVLSTDSAGQKAIFPLGGSCGSTDDTSCQNISEDTGVGIASCAGQDCDLVSQHGHRLVPGWRSPRRQIWWLREHTVDQGP